MSRNWIIQAKDYPSAPGEWGDTCTIDVRPYLPNGTVTAVRVRSITIPFLVYNVMSDNELLTMTIGGVAYTATIPHGFYTGAALMTVAKNALNLAIALSMHTVDIQFDSTSYRVTITVSDGGGIQPFDLAALNINGYSISILRQFGFTNDTIHNVAHAAVVSDGPLNTSADRYFLLTCNEANGKHGVYESLSTKDWHDGIIAYIPIPWSVNPGDVFHYEPPEDTRWVNLVRGSTRGLLTFNIRRANFLSLGPAQIDWTMELEVRP